MTASGTGTGSHRDWQTEIKVQLEVTTVTACAVASESGSTSMSVCQLEGASTFEYVMTSVRVAQRTNPAGHGLESMAAARRQLESR